MNQLDRITQNPEQMGGKPCIRGMRVTLRQLRAEIASGALVTIEPNRMRIRILPLGE